MAQLVLLGAPGSGKGTQASRLVSEMSYKHVSTGDLLRGEIKKGTDLGQKVDGILKAGDLVDDQTMLELLRANIDLSSGNYIFDGFPRNIDQAKALEVAVLGDAEYKGIFFNMPTETLVERLTNRRTCKDCNAVYNLKFLPPKEEGVCDKCGGTNLYQRDDDQEDVIRNRMLVYNDGVGPILEYYRQSNRLIEVDASRDIEEVFKDVKSSL